MKRRCVSSKTGIIKAEKPAIQKASGGINTLR